VDDGTRVEGGAYHHLRAGLIVTRVEGGAYQIRKDVPVK